jgi:hypothetical protein
MPPYPTPSLSHSGLAMNNLIKRRKRSNSLVTECEVVKPVFIFFLVVKLQLLLGLVRNGVVELWPVVIEELLCAVAQ